MRHSTLADWLAWQETLHPARIALGLDRVRAVLHRMGLRNPAYTVLTVGGTNGKGSCVALSEAILRAAGYRVGAFLSPHVSRYNERVRIDGEDAPDDALCASFARIDAARGDTLLTYFEFGTLAAFDLFARARVEVAVLEVGMGGRLDAVNALDADAALVTNVGLDHMEWLGATREAIATEKAHVFRPSRPALCGDPDPPAPLLEHARRIGARLARVNQEFGYARSGREWNWWGVGRRRVALPVPSLLGPHQVHNAACALALVESVAERFPVTQDDLRRGLQSARLPGRFQVAPGQPEWIYDVAHNPHGAECLASALAARPTRGATRVVFAALRDKDVEAMARALAAAGVATWDVAGLAGERGADGAETAARLAHAGITARISETVPEACARAAADAGPEDRIVVCGSFHTVGEALAAASAPTV